MSSENGLVRWLERPQNISIVEQAGYLLHLTCRVQPIDPATRCGHFRWFSNSVPIVPGSKYSIQANLTAPNIYSRLQILQPDVLDSASYRCELECNRRRESATAIVRVNLGDLPYQDAIIDSGDDDEDETIEKPDLASKIYFADDMDTNAFCEPYRGRICRHLLGNRMIYVTSASQQENTERLLASAGSDFRTRPSVSFSSHGSIPGSLDPCKEATMFLACINAFPLCEEPVHPVPVLKQPRVRQLCLSDCLYIEKDACKSSKQTRNKSPAPSAFTINPFKRMKIPTCTELPPSSSHADCLSLSELRGLNTRIEHQCYNSTGQQFEYLGVVSQSQSGRQCLPWNSIVSSTKSEVAHLSYVFHPELGNHQYCRNPRHSFPFTSYGIGREPADDRRPWCFVDSGFGERNPVAEPCAIPKCSAIIGGGAAGVAGIRSELWMVILPSIMVPAGLALLLLLIYLVFCKKWRSSPADKPKPSAGIDKKSSHNTYGTAFLASHRQDECSDLLENRRYPSQVTSMCSSSAMPYLRDPMVFPDRLLNHRKSPPIISSAVIRSTTRRSRQQMSADTCPSPNLQSIGEEFGPNACCREIPYHHIRFLFEIGQGRFGACFIGEIIPPASRSQRCLIKTLKDNNRLDQFLSESGALTSCPIKHPHITNILGLCPDPPATLFDHLPFDLHELISDQESSVLDLFNLLPQIASALVYLSGRQIVHKDVATRNVLVDEARQTSKLSFDIGQCRNQYLRDYYRISNPAADAPQLLPIRWMAPEAVTSGILTTHSDVWSFGVLLWEFYSRGERPFDGNTNPEVIERLRDRKLLKPPATLATHIRTLMIECWHELPCDRPSFHEIYKTLKNTRSTDTVAPAAITPINLNSPFSDIKDSTNTTNLLNSTIHQFKV